MSKVVADKPELGAKPEPKPDSTPAAKPRIQGQFEGRVKGRSEVHCHAGTPEEVEFVAGRPQSS